jgi:xanthine dehydrogenase YagT iron-sulfur-binding subunit
MSDEDAVKPSAHGGPEDGEEAERLRPIISRREFLIGAGAGVAASAAAAGAVTVVQNGATRGTVVAPMPAAGAPGVVSVPAVVPAPAAPAAAPSVSTPAGPIAEKRITLKVNGRTHQVMVQARATLADVLRYQLGLTGTKIGCNRAECGACTVVIDGRNVYACTQMAFASEGKEILTVEGLARDPSRFEGLHPLQQGFIVKDAPQCAFCMSGQLMSAYTLLQIQPKPTLEQIRLGLSGNICRCGNYNHLWDAVAWAAEHPA